jgi:hypothetical protein
MLAIDENLVGAVAADEGEDLVVPVVGDDPAEAVGLAVAAVEGRDVAIDAVEIGDELHRAARQHGVLRRPGEGRVGVPFGLGAELAAHEQQLLARMGPHPGQEERGDWRSAASRRRACGR